MTPPIQLDQYEARLLGVLIEKAFTTPDQYPLTLNAAVNGANQKSNREPVLSLSEDEVSTALEGLGKKDLAQRVFLDGSRVDKYVHIASKTLSLGRVELAIVAELLMRGPQAPGELRARVNRMAPIGSIEQLMSALEPLVERGLVQRVAAAAGGRAERYVQLLSPGLHSLDPPTDASVPSTEWHASSAVPNLAARVEVLEHALDRLRSQFRALAEKLGETLEE